MRMKLERTGQYMNSCLKEMQMKAKREGLHLISLQALQ